MKLLRSRIGLGNRQGETRHSCRRRFNAIKKCVTESTHSIINANAVLRAKATYETIVMGSKAHRPTFHCMPKRTLPVAPCRRQDRSHRSKT